MYRNHRFSVRYTTNSRQTTVTMERRVKALFSKTGTSVVGTRAMTTYRAIPRPRTKFNAVRFSASYATGQVTTIRRNVPEALTTVALQNPVALLNVRRLDDIGTTDYRTWRRNLIGSTVSAATASPPAFGNGAESSSAEKVQALPQYELVVTSVEDLVRTIIVTMEISTIPSKIFYR